MYCGWDSFYSREGDVKSVVVVEEQPETHKGDEISRALNWPMDSHAENRIPSGVSVVNPASGYKNLAFPRFFPRLKA
jgi:hypothetical protein